MSKSIKNCGARTTVTITAPVFRAGGKPSTWFPPGGLVEQRRHKQRHVGNQSTTNRPAAITAHMQSHIRQDRHKASKDGNTRMCAHARAH